ncbi:hypothetical protein LIER_26699 [Lithospermum erythrorhizon]|uniref:Uncharacterized protein n=1 Tax=Lithospermum erythrorhizon TaxID=34254 RepID=A0AAV3R9A9_LITER
MKEEGFSGRGYAGDSTMKSQMDASSLGFIKRRGPFQIQTIGGNEVRGRRPGKSRTMMARQRNDCNA